MEQGKILLIEQFLDDSVSRQDAERIFDFVKTDPEFRKELGSALRMKGLITASQEKEYS